MEFHLRLGGGLRRHLGGLSHPKPMPGYVPAPSALRPHNLELVLTPLFVEYVRNMPYSVIYQLHFHFDLFFPVFFSLQS